MSKNSIGHCRKSTTSLARLFLTVDLALFAACARPTQPGGEGAASTPQRAQTTTAAPAQSKSDESPTATPPAMLEEVRGVVARIYRDAVVVEAERAAPFIVGDFNGDGSEDVAVVVRPSAGKLSEINGEYANWIVEDPREVRTPEVHGDVKVFPKRPGPATVRQRELLLAVIHGYRGRGWHDPLASQTYLLKGAAGGEMSAQSTEAVLNAATDKAKLPQLRGDVIRERLAGGDGFIYWTGAKYAWSGPASHGPLFRKDGCFGELHLTKYGSLFPFLSRIHVNLKELPMHRTRILVCLLLALLSYASVPVLAIRDDWKITFVDGKVADVQ